ncbi:hypothetical protein B5G38_14520 [Gemmiger sp. An87]|nr:hypothetical protein B5G38_14520 [Gemmiger sp. An87]
MRQGVDHLRNIAIVEDEDLAAQALIDHIKQYEAQTGQSFQIFRFANGADFLQDYRAVYAVVFLDVQMPRMNGLETALQLRRCDKNVSIIFITNLVQYALKGYEVDAVSYLIKPVSYYDFSMKFKKALDIYLLNEDRSFTVNTPGGLCRISTDKLMYVEIMNHRLFYHLIDDVIEMTGVLSGVEQQLSRFGFLRCNKCYLVNPKFIVKVKGSTVQVGDNLLQISRPRRAAFLAELANWYAGSAGGE